MEDNTRLKQFLVFKLENEEYGLDIQRVTTIIEKEMDITRVPHTPQFIKGVINLRGEIIPVMCLRSRFDIPTAEYTDDTRIIVIQIEDISFGIIVDAVAEVIRLSEDMIENITNFSSNFRMDFILGAAKLENRIVTIINIDKLIDFNKT